MGDDVCFNLRQKNFVRNQKKRKSKRNSKGLLYSRMAQTGPCRTEGAFKQISKLLCAASDFCQILVQNRKNLAGVCMGKYADNLCRSNRRQAGRTMQKMGVAAIDNRLSTTASVQGFSS
jgi:hypothetical protein